MYLVSCFACTTLKYVPCTLLYLYQTVFCTWYPVVVVHTVLNYVPWTLLYGCNCTILYYVPVTLLFLYYTALCTWNPAVPVIHCAMYLVHCCNCITLYYVHGILLYLHYIVLCTWYAAVAVPHRNPSGNVSYSSSSSYTYPWHTAVQILKLYCAEIIIFCTEIILYCTEIIIVLYIQGVLLILTIFKLL